MPKKNFSKITDSAVSKFLSNTDNTHTTDDKHHTSNNELMTGQLDLISIVSDNTSPTTDTQYTHNKQQEHNTSNTHNTYSAKEIKSKRLNLLIQPSLLEDIKKISYINQLSANELIVRVLKDYTEKEEQKEKIIKYDNLF